MSFGKYLKLQMKRQDPIGDFARDFAMDTDKGKYRTLSTQAKHLERMGASPEALRTHRWAWDEYQRRAV